VRRKISIRPPTCLRDTGATIASRLATANAWPELAEALTVMTEHMPHARRTGPAPSKPLTALTGPITLAIEFDVAPRR
jgi:hypothetical protein